jgi:arylsulfatase A-like enzyme
MDLSPKARAYYASISRFDDRVGELLSHLDARGLSDRTLVVYVSDNGWDQGPHAPGPDDSGDGPKGKKSLYELGFRTPIILHWPGHVPANSVNDALVSTVDLFPTFLDFAGLDSPADRPGSSLRPVVEGAGDWPRREVIGARGARQSQTRRAHGAPMMTRAFFLRSRDWHYIVYPDIQRQELYDLRVDPREDHNVAGANRERIREFRARIATWREKVEGPGAR